MISKPNRPVANRSEPSSSRKKEYALWTAFFVLLFLIGWAKGYHPKFDFEAIWGRPKPLLILSYGSPWLTNDFIQNLSEETKIDIQIETVDDFTEFEARLIPLDSPALVWAPISWIKAFSEQGLLANLEEELGSSAFDQLSPDFKSDSPQSSFIPLLWSMENKTLRIEGLAIPHGGDQRSAARKIIHAWLKKDLMLSFVKKSPASSTLRSLDHEDLSLEKKSRTLRDLDLRSLKK